MTKNHDAEIVDINAQRVIDAISRIGYTSDAAIMDIVDNSVAANATKIRIEITRKDGYTLNQKNNVHLYRIVDNGAGMDNISIMNALRLGSEDNYSEHSLSKFGLGLKSAGFSLGSKIKVISKQKNTFSNIHYVDRDLITSDYIVHNYSPSKEEIDKYNAIISNISGTIIEITSSIRNNNQSAQNTLKHLHTKLGVVYYEYLKKDGLVITIREGRLEEKKIQPLDILFFDEAEDEFDRDTYNAKKPCKVFNEEIPLLISTKENQDPKKALLQITIFPQKNMSSYSKFSSEEQDRIKLYDIAKKNSGFFIYRNDRLIRWGDTLGIIGRDDIGFRAKLFIYSEHDDVLHVDVSKQKLDFPEKILDSINAYCRKPLEYSRQAFEICKNLDKQNAEGSKFTENNSDIEIDSLDDMIQITQEEQELKDKRIQQKIDQTKDLEKGLIDIQAKNDSQFQLVRYSTNVDIHYLWETGYHPDHGDFVVINKNHPFYKDVLSRIGETKEKQAIEAIIWCSAIGERYAYEKNIKVDNEVIEKILNSFKKSLTYQLSNWASHNRKLF